jgi:molybdenum cofactor cytidylyltransferase
MALVRLSASGIVTAGLGHVLVVVGRDGELVSRSLEELPVSVVMNPEFANGVSASLRVGVTEVMRLWPGADAVMVALGDQPLGGSGIVERLVEAFAEEGALGRGSIIAPRFRGAPGNPVIFGRDVVPELLALSGDRGARSVVEREASRVRYMDFDRDAPRDVDTVEDLAALARVLRCP